MHRAKVSEERAARRGTHVPLRERNPERVGALHAVGTPLRRAVRVLGLALVALASCSAGDARPGGNGEDHAGAGGGAVGGPISHAGTGASTNPNAGRGGGASSAGGSHGTRGDASGQAGEGGVVGDAGGAGAPESEGGAGADGMAGSSPGASCTVDSDCHAWNRVCNQTTHLCITVGLADCTRDRDCGGGRICRSGACVSSTGGASAGSAESGGSSGSAGGGIGGVSGDSGAGAEAGAPEAGASGDGAASGTGGTGAGDLCPGSTIFAATEGGFSCEEGSSCCDCSNGEPCNLPNVMCNAFGFCWCNPTDAPCATNNDCCGNACEDNMCVGGSGG